MHFFSLLKPFIGAGFMRSILYCWGQFFSFPETWIFLRKAQKKSGSFGKNHFDFQ